MKVKLRVKQGKLRNRRGANVGMEIAIRKPVFLIGTGESCQMRCQSSTVSERHCELTIDDGRLEIRDLGSESGTIVNDERIDAVCRLSDGDQLRIGRLEFEVVIEQPAIDPMSDFVSDLLVEADAEDRARRLEDPRARQFDVEQAAGEQASAEEPAVEPQSPKRPPKRPPAKLPPPPKYVADNTVVAAQETLQKIFDRPKR